jgi:hypothetical protein
MLAAWILTSTVERERSAVSSASVPFHFLNCPRTFRITMCCTVKVHRRVRDVDLPVLVRHVVAPRSPRLRFAGPQVAPSMQ